MQIKKGDKIRIKDNLMDELIRVGFDRGEITSFVDEFKGKKCKALEVYQDTDQEINGVLIEGTNEWFVTVDLCCEIPINACEAIQTTTNTN
ncbi:hypothetical protein [Dysgonomonas capnocytophagoides]|uniref:hypothetical protein n=1 Tax=Dysgonomonas capnocytophagoides TaxID=45254 RepID=UPI002922F05B|nr:hypothetical protein DCPSUM001_33570 [Dysgonomonas capnocytophagoides]